ncbi:MAG: hypothetical protein IPH46_05010 [Bacteroidetes bacterium]|nr:hypothetical protein [Bacteroidota bacterium]
MAKAKKIILKDEDLRDSKEASILFHNIIKASVTVPLKKKVVKKKRLNRKISYLRYAKNESPNIGAYSPKVLLSSLCKRILKMLSFTKLLMRQSAQYRTIVGSIHLLPFF